MIKLEVAQAKLPAAVDAERAAYLRSIRRLATAINAYETKKRGSKREKTRQNSAMPVSVSLVTDGAMKKLNKNYRGKTTTTDVLSFAYGESGTPLFRGEIAGEVIISYEQARRQARAAGIRLRDEFILLTVHGVLHILGYDHEKSAARLKRMHRAEAEILGALGLKSGLIGR